MAHAQAHAHIYIYFFLITCCQQVEQKICSLYACETECFSGICSALHCTAGMSNTSVCAGNALKVLAHQAEGEATRISDAKTQILCQGIFSTHTKRDANMRIKLAKQMKLGTLSVMPKSQWSRPHPQPMMSW